MADKYLPVTEDLYDAVLLLQRRLQNAYGDDVSISDTVDFLGHQFFINKRLLDGARIAMEMFKGLIACPQDQKSVVDDVLDIFGLRRPEDPTCILETGVEVPMHWATTRWVLDVEARNMVRCLSKPETEGQAPSSSRKVDIS
jgi:hypothetical protein